MRTLLLLLSLTLASATCLAEPLTLPQLVQRTEAPDSLQGRFSQAKYLSQFDTTLQSSGEFSYQRGVEIRWLTTAPLRSELTMTPGGLETRQQGTLLMKLDAGSQPAARIMSSLFFAVLSADWASLSDYFSLTLDAPDDQRWQARLEPVTPEIAAFVSRVELRGDRWLREAVLYEPRGDSTTIHFEPQPQ